MAYDQLALILFGLIQIIFVHLCLYIYSIPTISIQSQNNTPKNMSNRSIKVYPLNENLTTQESMLSLSTITSISEENDCNTYNPIILLYNFYYITYTKYLSLIQRFRVYTIILHINGILWCLTAIINLKYGYFNNNGEYEIEGIPHIIVLYFYDIMNTNNFICGFISIIYPIVSSSNTIVSNTNSLTQVQQYRTIFMISCCYLSIFIPDTLMIVYNQVWISSFSIFFVSALVFVSTIILSNAIYIFYTNLKTGESLRSRKSSFSGISIKSGKSGSIIAKSPKSLNLIPPAPVKINSDELSSSKGSDLIIISPPSLSNSTSIRCPTTVFDTLRGPLNVIEKISTESSPKAFSFNNAIKSGEKKSTDNVDHSDNEEELSCCSSIYKDIIKFTSVTSNKLVVQIVVFATLFGIVTIFNLISASILLKSEESFDPGLVLKPSSIAFISLLVKHSIYLLFFYFYVRTG